MKSLIIFAGMLTAASIIPSYPGNNSSGSTTADCLQQVATANSGASDSLQVIYPVSGELRWLNEATAEEWEWAIKNRDTYTGKDSSKYTEHQMRILDMVYDGEGAATRGAGCSWYCCAWPDTVYGSTHIGDFEAKNVHDENLVTMWMVDEKDAVGQSVTIVFPPASPRLTTFEIWNGYDRNTREWNNYGRVAEFKLLINGVPSAIFALRDFPQCQKFGIKPLTSPDKETPLRLTLEITKIYPGKKYDKVAVSEINFDGIDCH